MSDDVSERKTPKQEDPTFKRHKKQYVVYAKMTMRAAFTDNMKGDLRDQAVDAIMNNGRVEEHGAMEQIGTLYLLDDEGNEKEVDWAND